MTISDVYEQRILEQAKTNGWIVLREQTTIFRVIDAMGDEVLYYFMDGESLPLLYRRVFEAEDDKMTNFMINFGRKPPRGWMDPRPCTMCDMDEDGEHFPGCIYYYSSGSARRIEEKKQSGDYGFAEAAE